MPSSAVQTTQALIQKLEPDAAKIVQEIKKSDEAIYKKYDKTPGGRYLDNKGTITKTKLYELAYKAPKGAHLHIHFNSCLGPNVLLDIAAESAMKNNMYISTNVQGALTKKNLNEANIQFHFLGNGQTKVKSLFDPKYQGRKTPTDDVATYDKMLFQDFLTNFQARIGLDALPKSIQDAAAKGGSKALAMRWLQQKLVFSANQVTYDAGSTSTIAKQWDIFNARTQMMKGLFNYEYAYRRYTQLLLAEFVRENIQYAEIRPNFMMSNQVFKSSNPSSKMNNFDIMELIISEYTKFKADKKNAGFGGLKVIYCTPRSFDVETIKWSLNECLEMKKNAKIGPYIAGFDVIGPENKPNGLKYFQTVFQKFQQDCAKAKITCPFLFHAGESHNDPDGNLSVAMALGSKRIAHGFSVPKNEAVKKWAKEKKVCVECCPISNEILGLDPFIKNAAVYKLMAAEIPCALASDNPTLFSSNLSYDFYQFMIGDPKFSLSRWRKLMEDSLTHSVWNSESEKNVIFENWRSRYVKFLQDIMKNKSSSSFEPATGRSNGPSTTSTGARNGPAPAAGAKATGQQAPKPAPATGARTTGQQALRPANQTPRPTGTATGAPNQSANRTTAKPAAKPAAK